MDVQRYLLVLDMDLLTVGQQLDLDQLPRRPARAGAVRS